MSLSEFKHRIIKNHMTDRYTNYCLCFMIILAGILFFAIPGNAKNPVPFAAKLIFFLFTSCSGVYGFIAIRNQQRPDIWINKLSREQNVLLLNRLLISCSKTPGTMEPDYQQFIYQKRWWQLSYAVHLFAGDGMIAVKASSSRSFRGIIDLGASRRMERKIIAVVKEL